MTPTMTQPAPDVWIFEGGYLVLNRAPNGFSCFKHTPYGYAPITEDAVCGHSALAMGDPDGIAAELGFEHDFDRDYDCRIEAQPELAPYITPWAHEVKV